jgi:isopenicillin-N N-acyltransferase like protein
MRDIPFFSARGSAYECGQAIGRALRTDIHSNVADYAGIFLRTKGADSAAVRAFALKLVPAIEAYAPALVEEMRGLAQGAEAEFADIVALNARTEIMYGLGSTECTSLGVLPELTRAGHTMIGQNWDWKALVSGRTAVLGLEQPGHPRVLVFTEAGFVGKIGLNEAGIGVCANLLGSAHDKGQTGVPFHVILRAVLSAPNLHKAIQAVTLAQRGSSGNYLIGARGGEIIDIEATPEAFDVVLPQDGIIAHANHFLSPELQRVDTHRAESTLTFIRHERARRLFGHDRGQIDSESFMRVFRDHFSFPSAICRHEDPAQPAAERTISGASLIMDLEDGEILVAAGPPCEHEYRRHRVCA